jgi:hypothetical protein
MLSGSTTVLVLQIAGISCMIIFYVLARKRLDAVGAFGGMIAIGIIFWAAAAWLGSYQARQHSLASDPALPVVRFEWKDPKDAEVIRIQNLIGPNPKLLKMTDEEYIVFKPRQTEEDPAPQAVVVPRALVISMSYDLSPRK